LNDHPEDFRIHDALAAAYWIRNDSSDAEREWLEALRMQPGATGPLNSLGALYAQEKRFDQALPLLKRTVRLDPYDADGHLNLGAAYAEMGKTDRAEEQFRAAVLLFPLDFEAHNLLGKLYYDSQRLAAAEEQFRASLACEPNLAAYDYLGYIAMQRGDREQAEAVFTKALAVKRTDSHALFNLGLIHAASGKKTQAREELQAALASDPDNPEILAALEKLRQ
jgi:Flp pilus assembly protein TadD